MNKVRTQLMLCGGTGCHASGTRDFQTALQKELDRQGLAEDRYDWIAIARKLAEHAAAIAAKKA